MNASYVIYIKENCACCRRIQNFVRQHHLNIKIINVDLLPETVNLSSQVIIFPALLSENKLIAYGDDIVRCLSRRRN